MFLSSDSRTVNRRIVIDRSIIMAPKTAFTSHSGVQVVVRLRPLNEREQKKSTLPVIAASTNDKTVTVIKGSGRGANRSAFAFDNVFTAFSTQEEVFETTLKPVITDVLQGYCSCVCAYGQTGTGKTHTMEGPDLDNPEHYGVIPRAAEAIFEKLNDEELQYEEYKVTCSFLEIYNEELSDLLAGGPNNSNNTMRTPRKGATPLKRNNNSTSSTVTIMDGPDGPSCRGLSEQEVSNASELLDLMRMAQQQRKVGETNMNKQSSRSHCIFTLKVQAKRRLKDGAIFETRGELHMVDLAGSENAKTAGMENDENDKQRDRERMNINRSLLTLGRVVKILKEKSLKGEKASNLRIPYRDSKLTRVLTNALGGNSKTVIIATLSPSVTAIEESISTLNYAQAAMGIMNKPVSASYMTDATGSSAILARKDTGGSAASIEQWNEMETRLEYMHSQVEEAKAALARKHLQQAALVEQVEQAAIERQQHEEEMEKMKAEQAEMNKILRATQTTEAALTKEATKLIEALKLSTAASDKLYETVVKNREKDVDRRKASQEYNKSIVDILSNAMTMLSELKEQESQHKDTTTNLVNKSTEQGAQFLETSKEVLGVALESVQSAVSSLNANIMDEGGINSQADKLQINTTQQLGNVQSMIHTSEKELTSKFAATREKLNEFGSKLKGLEANHESSTETAMAVFEENVTRGKEKMESLVSTALSALAASRENEKRIRDATKQTVSDWKTDSDRFNDDVIQRAETQQTSVKQKRTMLNDELKRHEAVLKKSMEQGASTLETRKMLDAEQQRHETVLKQSKEQGGATDATIALLTTEMIHHETILDQSKSRASQVASSREMLCEEQQHHISVLNKATQQGQAVVEKSNMLKEELKRHEAVLVKSTSQANATLDTVKMLRDELQRHDTVLELSTNQGEATSKTRTMLHSELQRLESILQMSTDQAQVVVNKTDMLTEELKRHEAVLKLSSEQGAEVDQNTQMLTSEMQRHENISDQLQSQDNLLQASHAASLASHSAQDALLLKTQSNMKDSHKQQSHLLSVFVETLIPQVQKLVEDQVAEVLGEVNTGHSQFMENNASLQSNHAGITSSTLATLTEARDHAGRIREQADAAKANDESIIKHLKETKAVLSNIHEESACAKKNDEVIIQHLKDTKTICDKIHKETSSAKANDEAVIVHLDESRSVFDSIHAESTKAKSNDETVIQHLDTTKEVFDSIHEESTAAKSNDEAIIVHLGETKAILDDVHAETNTAKEVDEKIMAHMDETKCVLDKIHKESTAAKAADVAILAYLGATKTAFSSIHSETATAKENDKKVIAHLDQTKTTFEEIHSESNAAKSNDEDIIRHLDQTKTMFTEIQNVVKKEKSSVSDFTKRTSQQLQESENLEPEYKQLGETLESSGSQFSGFLAGDFSSSVKQSISELNQAGTTIVTFSKDEVLSTASANVREMEQPRGNVMANFTKECTTLESISSSGLTDIKNKAAESSQTATALEGKVRSISDGFQNQTAAEWNQTLASHKENVLKQANHHHDTAQERIDAVHADSRQVQRTTQNFCETTLLSNKEVPAVPVRVSIDYSERLSCTPGREAILASGRK